MNNKGFTLVELLGTLLIFVIIMGIAIVGYNSILEKGVLRSFTTYEDTMHAEAIELLSKHPELLPTNHGEKTFTLTQLGIDEFNNPRNSNDSCSSSYVKVLRNDVNNVTSITYTVCLICPNSNYNINGTECRTYEN